jgi:hypothetical protein
MAQPRREARRKSNPPGAVISDLLIIVSFGVDGRKGIHEKLVLRKDIRLKNESFSTAIKSAARKGYSP